MTEAQAVGLISPRLLKASAVRERSGLAKAEAWADDPVTLLPPPLATKCLGSAALSATLPPRTKNGYAKR